MVVCFDSVMAFFGFVCLYQCVAVFLEGTMAMIFCLYASAFNYNVLALLCFHVIVHFSFSM